VFIGEASSIAQTWDFSTYAFEFVARSQSINPAGAPLIGSFPSANIVLYERSWIPGPDTIIVWNYKELQADRFLLHGLSDATSVLFTYDPPAIHAVVPLEYGDSWIRERDSTFIMEGYWIISESQVVADAFGTMKLPGGEYPCLRITQNNVSETHTPMGTTTTTTRSYHFYSKDVHEVNLPTILENQFGLTTIEVPGVKYSKRESGTALPESQGVELFTLLPNYPNPFTHSTVLSYRVTKQANVLLRVFDFLGQEVITLVNENQIPGGYNVTFNAEGLPPGIYFCRLSVNDKSLTGRMLKYPRE